MPYLTAAFLFFVLLASQAEIFAQDAIEPSLEELERMDRNFGAGDEAATGAQSSDKIPTPPAPITPARLIGTADLVVEATVADVYYMHESAHNQPYTYTVFDVDRVLQGEHTEATLTIKQMGGPSQDGTQVNIVSHTEFFNPGERELLFLDLEGERMRLERRLRVYEGALYDTDGYGLLSGPDGGLRLSRNRNPAERFSSINIGAETLHKHFSEPDPEEQDVDNGWGDARNQSEASLAEPGLALTLEEFVKASRADRP